MYCFIRGWFLVDQKSDPRVKYWFLSASSISRFANEGLLKAIVNPMAAVYIPDTISEAYLNRLLLRDDFPRPLGVFPMQKVEAARAHTFFPETVCGQPTLPVAGNHDEAVKQALQSIGGATNVGSISLAEMKRHFRTKIKEVHPDKISDAESGAKTVEINLAYEWLTQVFEQAGQYDFAQVVEKVRVMAADCSELEKVGALRLE